jgi:hypothetical protein
MHHLKRHHFFYYCKTIGTFFAVFMTIVTGHYYLINFYASQCASSLLQTILNAGSPLCQFVNLIQYKLAQQYIYFWAAAGATVAAWILHKLGCWNIPQQDAIVPRNNTRRHRSSNGNGNGNGNGPTFTVVEDDDDDDDDINGSRKQVISDNPNDALVDQIAQWKIANPHLTFTSEKLQELLCNEEEEDEEEGGGGETGEGEDNDGNDAASPCFVWSRQNGPQNNPPIEFNVSMVGVEDVPVEESFYSDNDDE